jgi:hypothetical protein
VHSVAGEKVVKTMQLWEIIKNDLLIAKKKGSREEVIIEGYHQKISNLNCEKL